MMKQYCFSPNLPANGLPVTVTAPPSKSLMHRYLIGACLYADRKTDLFPIDCSDDIMATVRCLRAIGACIDCVGGHWIVTPIRRDHLPNEVVLPCRESATTLRFLLPIVAALGIKATFTMEKSLARRSHQTALDVLNQNGCHAEIDDGQIHLSGRLRPTVFSVSATESSQFAGGFLMALPLMNHASLSLVGELVSKPYFDMTVAVMQSFGYETTVRDKICTVRRAVPSLAESETIVIDGDWSNAAFWLVSGAIGPKEVTVCGLNEKSIQGDVAMLRYLKEFGADFALHDDSVTVHASPLKACNLDLTDSPDLLMPLALLAANGSGRSSFYGISRLRGKESDRIKSVVDVLTKLGISCSYQHDVLTINGGMLKGGVVDSHHDHRIAMMAAVSALASEESVTVQNGDCVSKSYPAFWTELSQFGDVKEV